MWWTVWKGFEIFFLLLFFFMWLELDQKNRTRWLMQLETRWRLPHSLAKHETDLQGNLLFILKRINDFTCSTCLLWIPVHPVLTFNGEQEAQALLLFYSYLFASFSQGPLSHLYVALTWIFSPEFVLVTVPRVCTHLYIVSIVQYRALCSIWLHCILLNRSDVFSRHVEGVMHTAGLD